MAKDYELTEAGQAVSEGPYIGDDDLENRRAQIMARRLGDWDEGRRRKTTDMTTGNETLSYRSLTGRTTQDTIIRHDEGLIEQNKRTKDNHTSKIMRLGGRQVISELDKREGFLQEKSYTYRDDIFTFSSKPYDTKSVRRSWKAGERFEHYTKDSNGNKEVTEFKGRFSYKIWSKVSQSVLSGTSLETPLSLKLSTRNFWGLKRVETLDSHGNHKWVQSSFLGFRGKGHFEPMSQEEIIHRNRQVAKAEKMKGSAATTAESSRESVDGDNRRTKSSDDHFLEPDEADMASSHDFDDAAGHESQSAEHHLRSKSVDASNARQALLERRRSEKRNAADRD
ncbi:hypothetical protein [Rhizobium terrae]|uniref:hypothetical protein n=1 Tax=Rhizobium terrae TaxID=2171756 RepID=UPI000E3CC53E|nr:hypothetical protein [Rhizobium terrae]